MKEKEKLTILLYSHGITAVTGFANQIRSIGMGLQKAGHTVIAVHKSYRGFPCHIQELDNMLTLPTGSQEWGEDVLPFYISKYEPDIVLTLLDIWCAQYITQIPKNHKWYWLRYFPFDTENVVGFWKDYLNDTDLPIAMSKFGKKLLDDNKIHGVYVPHGVDTNVFKPATYKERAKLRAKMPFIRTFPDGKTDKLGQGIAPDDFVIICVAHNQFRKNIDRLLVAFARFAQGKNDVKLLLHMQPRDNIGWDLPQMINDFGLRGKVFFTNMSAKLIADIHVSESELRDLYCLADVHMLLTGGEGFGLPFVEAMACGLPNIATAWTTPKEFFGKEMNITQTLPDGRKVKQKVLKNERGILIPPVVITKHRTGGDWAMADTDIASDALQYLYENKDVGQKMGRKARKFAVENYDWDTAVIPQWIELIDNVEKHIGKGKKKHGVKMMDVV